MVSRRNFFAIATIMAALFFLFQALNVAKELGNNYRVNSFAQPKEELPEKADAYRGDVVLPSKEEAAYIGEGEEDGVKATVENWCLYSKRVLRTYRSLSEYVASGQEADILLLNAQDMDWQGEAARLCAYADQGILLIFCNLPEPSVLARDGDLRKLLGIQEIQAERAAASGLCLYQGLLLGGDAVFRPEYGEEAEESQVLAFEFPWYRLGAGTKTYMAGIPGGEIGEGEDYPPVIWRNSYGESSVFAVNGDYLASAEGLGLLAGFMAEAKAYELYPVVNAQNLILASFPGLADENSEEMEELYSRSMSGLFRDLVLPPLESLVLGGSLGLTCMVQPQFDYGDDALPIQKNLVFYLKEINELGGEAGLTATSVSETDLGRKLSEDAAFFQGVVPKFEFSSLYVGDCEEDGVRGAIGHPGYGSLRTVVAPYDGGSDLIGYQSESVTRQETVVDGFSHTSSEDFRVRSIETALGYTSILLDLERVAYPREDSDRWEKLLGKLPSSEDAYWGSYGMFEGTTAAECDGRIRSFLTLDYAESCEEDTITLNISGMSGAAWFLLRTHSQKIESMDGGTYAGIEEDAYLIEAKERDVTIRLVPAEERFFYSGREEVGR